MSHIWMVLCVRESFKSVLLGFREENLAQLCEQLNLYEMEIENLKEQVSQILYVCVCM